MESMIDREKVGIVTGAGAGIGRAIASRLAADGVRVALVDIALQGIEELARELDPRGESVVAIRADVGSESEVDACVADVVSRFGRLDILVNNAGISPKKADGTKATLVEISLAEWEHVLRVNLTSTFLMCKATIPHIVQQVGGSIVSISSSAALDGGVLAATHYAASKGAVSAMTRTLAKELAPRGVRVNAVAPGRVATGMAKLSSPERNRAALDRIPLGRFAEPNEVADAVAYLISDRASYVTGITLNVSGGYVPG
ncbi:MAG: SDR family oxidoreductase [Burkholderiales bacterium]|nr:SDR family oxidoreductase [Burkholderiales bacterium]